MPWKDVRQLRNGWFLGNGWPDTSMIQTFASLLVNDSPNDVVVAGLAGYLALSTAPVLARPADPRDRLEPRALQARTAPAASP